MLRVVMILCYYFFVGKVALANGGKDVDKCYMPS